MSSEVKQTVVRRDELYEATSRTVRWVVLALVLITYPLHGPNTVTILSILGFTAIYNALRYSRRLHGIGLFNSRVNSLALDHVFTLTLVGLTGGLSSPYYSLFFILIIGSIAAYGITGFAFAVSSQVVITLLLLRVDVTPVPGSQEFQLIIKLIIVIIFSLVAEQTVRSRNDDYLLEGRFTLDAQNERQRLRSLINSLSSAVLAIDEQGRVYLCNAATLALLNVHHELSGRDINEVLPLHDPAGHKFDLMEAIESGTHTLNRQDLRYRASDGSILTLDLTVSPVDAYGIKQGTAGGFMVVFHDITKEKSLDEERDEFISVVSHELRTPLAIAEANISTALLPGYAHIDPKAKVLLEQGHQNLVFLSTLIQDLTTLSRAERGDLKVELELVDAANLAQELVRDYRPQAETKNLELNLELGDDLATIVTSQAELREILQNFLTNAIKYTSAGHITLAVHRRTDGTEFSIHDTGIGIGAADKDKIFSKFYRSEDYRTRSTGGTGLGLYITRKLAEKLGITVSFTSRLNHGSTFHAHVPLAEGAPALKAVKAAATSHHVS